MSKITLVRAVQTCVAAPSQWNAWDIHGGYWYLWFRDNRGFMGRTYNEDNALIKFHYTVPAISLEEFLMLAGVEWAPELEVPGTNFQAPPLPEDVAAEAVTGPADIFVYDGGGKLISKGTITLRGGKAVFEVEQFDVNELVPGVTVEWSYELWR